jgi:hypothetical protein
MVKKAMTPRRSVAKKPISPRPTVKFWAVELSGDSSDLESWEEALREPFDPWVEFQRPPHGGPRILRSKEFDNLTSYQEVNTRAQIMVDRLNGTLRVPTQTRKVSIGYIWRQLRDGATVGGAGKSEGSSRTPAQHWLSYASSHDVAAEMLMLTIIGSKPSRLFSQERRWWRRPPPRACRSRAQASTRPAAPHRRPFASWSCGRQAWLRAGIFE